MVTNGKTVIYICPIIRKMKKIDYHKYILHHMIGAKKFKKIINCKIKRFIHWTNSNRVIFIGHTWVIKDNFISIDKLIKKCPFIKTVILFSCFSTAFAKGLSKRNRHIKFVGFKEYVKFSEEYNKGMEQIISDSGISKFLISTDNCKMYINGSLQIFNNFIEC